ncbi:hypothetical protein P10VF_254 [Rhizobium phage vB_RleM_P10VF]|uniref:Uncharacterized protein n=1 Tax=Rhizobium phage vB_RleM_P10VF TaxID=1527770 RepID=A0A076YL13_9CAUD|nr:hypothetical protein P10VF_254 [Rhizobium phage vB_RleM_P10VF]AIK68467.1 hypothetical protein P10VF_254 [Rhizobium phage vB_RleM_P10VF]
MSSKFACESYASAAEDIANYNEYIDSLCGLCGESGRHRILCPAFDPTINEPKTCAPVVSIKPMKLSDGSTDYYVSIQVGDREITPHKHKIKGRAEYDVANWNYIFFGGEQPDILAFQTESNDGID